MSKKRLLISSHVGMSHRNILMSPTYQVLKQNFEITVISFNDKNNHLHFYSKEKLVRTHPLDPSFIKKARDFFNVEYFGLWFKHKTTASSLKISRLRAEKRLVRVRKPLILGLIYSLIPLSIRRNISRRYYLDKNINLKDFDLIFLLSIDMVPDRVILASALNQSIPVSMLVHSWDNVSSKALMSQHPNQILVWNEMNAAECTLILEIPQSKVIVVGGPQFELYRGLDLKKESFYERLFCDPLTPIITYVCNSIVGAPDESDFILKLLISLRDKFEDGFKLVIRLHPEVRQEEYQKIFANEKNVILDTPTKLFSASTSFDDFFSENICSSVNEFAELMKFSKIIINYFSTTSIDAAIFQVPAITPGFNVTHPSESWNSAKRWSRITHYKSVVDEKLVFMPQDMNELVEQIEGILEGKLIYREMCSKLEQKIAPNIKSSVLINNALENLLMERL
jgi:hypothetical protein